MAPKKDAKKEEEDAAEEAPVGPLPLWVYGINDHLDVDVLTAGKAVEKSGVFAEDVETVARKVGIVPHTMLKAKAKEGSAAERCVTVTSTLMDRVNVELFACVIPQANIESVRFSQCTLDIDMVALLGESLKDSNVRTCYLDWNPLEVQLGEIPLQEAREGEPPIPRPEDIDEAEGQRRARQEKRGIYIFEREVSKAGYETMQIAVDSLKVAHGDNFVTEKREWIPIKDFVTEFGYLGIGQDDLSEVMSILDGPYFGSGDGGVILAELTEMCKAARHEVLGDAEPGAPREKPDELGKVFASFLKGGLEKVSFRSCRIAILEIYDIANALAESLHIRQLNLWGNRLDDQAAAVVLDALATNHTLEYLGLGCNRVGNATVEKLGAICGRLVDAAELPDAQARIGEQEKRKAGFAKGGPPTYKDPAGNPRYAGDQMHVDVLVDVNLPPEEPPAEGEEPVPVVAKLLCQNTQIRCVDLTTNKVTDRNIVKAMQPWGYKAPVLLLKDNPVVKEFTAEPLPQPAGREEVHGGEILIGWAVDPGPPPPAELPPTAPPKSAL
jgi:hypothetical protein